MIYQMVSFSMTLNDSEPFGVIESHWKRHHWPNPNFKGTPLSTLSISETVQDRYSYNGILIGTYTRPTQRCHFEWSCI